jgi:hypothetical protein
MSRKNNKGIWEYLDSIGILEKGTDAEIKEAKLKYRKKYLLKYKQNQRSKKPEFNINFSNEKGEYHNVEYAAKAHKMSITAFIRSAVLAYLNQRYVVPNQGQIAHLEQILSNCLNEIQTIVRIKDKYYFEKESKMELIEKRIERLEAEINQIFRNPPLVEHDHQSQIIQETMLQKVT